MEQSTQFMTSEDLYKTLLRQSLTKYSDMLNHDLSMFEIPNIPESDIAKDLVDCKEKLKYVLSEINFYRIPEIDLDLSTDIQNTFRVAQQEYDNRMEALMLKHETELREDRLSYDMNKKAIEDEVLGSAAPVKYKHEELLKFEPIITKLFKRYGIASNEMYVDMDINILELETLIDRALLTCKSIESKSDDLIKRITSPLHDEPSIAYSYIALALIVLWLLFPIIGIVYIFNTIKETYSVYHNIESYNIAKSLMAPIDFLKYVDTSKLNIAPYDNTGIVKRHSDELSTLYAENPKLKYEHELSKYRSDAGLKWIGEEISGIKKDVEERLAAIKSGVEKAIECVDSKLNDLKQNTPILGEHINSSAVMDTNYFLALNDGVDPVYEDFGLNNITIVGGINEATNLVKILFVNMLLSVRARCLRINIYDPDYLGQHFSEYTSQAASEYIDISKLEFNKVFENMRKEVSNNIQKLQTLDILDYNKKAEELGMLTMQYSLYIIVSGIDDKIFENKAFMEFIKYSATYGIFIWVIYKKALPGTRGLPSSYSPDDSEPLVYDNSIGARAIKTFEYALENNKPTLLDYRGKFMDNVLPSDKWWTGNTTKGVRVRVGLRDGDPAKPEYIHFNDSDAHFLTTGSTGSGKSVTIDTIMLTMMHEYPPDELTIVYLDLKNSEVAKYTKNEASLLPHAKVLAGTSDGEYCLSVIDWAMSEMQRRAALYSKYKLQKVEDLRTMYDDPTRPDYDPEVHLPRIVIIVDEFKVLFDPSRVPQKIISALSDKLSSLTLLGRAASIHLWFIAQDMKGTLPTNIQENFSLRGCLRATKAISESILGNTAAGLLTEKAGWFYTNNSAGQNAKANKLWKIPFANPNQIKESIADLGALSESRGLLGYGAKLYDENVTRTESDFYEAYNSNEILSSNGMRFMLGERTVYSEKTSPFNIMFSKDEKENLVSLAFDQKNMLDILSTFIHNITGCTEKCHLLINSADKDTIKLLDLERYVPEDWSDFMSPNYPLDDYLEDIEELIEDREQLEYDAINPLYILNICWERKEGVSVDESYSHVSRLVKLMSRGNQCKVHFIYIGREHGLPNRIGTSCNHSIAAKVDSRSSIFLLSDDIAEKLRTPEPGKSSFALYKFGSKISKFKIYEFPIIGKIEERDVG